jgi:hypothetical protein
MSRFTMHAVATAYDTARALADALVAAVIDYSGVSGGTRIYRVNFEQAFDNPPDPDPGLYVRTVVFAVWHRSN